MTGPEVIIPVLGITATVILAISLYFLFICHWWDAILFDGVGVWLWLDCIQAVTAYYQAAP